MVCNAYILIARSQIGSDWTRGDTAFHSADKGINAAGGRQI